MEVVMVESKLLLATVNALLGFSIAALAFRRLDTLSPGVPLRKITPLALVLCAGLVSACQPWMGHWPSPSQVFISIVVFVYVWSTQPPGCGAS